MTGGKVTDRLIFTIGQDVQQCAAALPASFDLPSHRSVSPSMQPFIQPFLPERKPRAKLFQNTSSLPFHWLSRTLRGLRLGAHMFSTRAGRRYVLKIFNHRPCLCFHPSQATIIHDCSVPLRGKAPTRVSRPADGPLITICILGLLLQASADRLPNH